MRDDGDFITDLRTEIDHLQDRRQKYVMAKLAFVTGLLGIGFATGENQPPTEMLLYLIPLITFVFDLYILGEDFSIKRAGRFIRNCANAPKTEQIWEEVAFRTRDNYTLFAAPIASSLALFAAYVGLRVSGTNSIPLWWVALGIMFVLVVMINRWLQSITFKTFNKKLCEARECVNTLDNITPRPDKLSPSKQQDRFSFKGLFSKMTTTSCSHLKRIAEKLRRILQLMS